MVLSFTTYRVPTATGVKSLASMLLIKGGVSSIILTLSHCVVSGIAIHTPVLNQLELHKGLGGQ